MKRWEDIAKDKLEGYESRLPEGSLAEFRALRDGAGAARPQHRYAAVWALAGVVALLAAVLLLRLPGEPEEGARIVQQPPVTAPVGQDSSAFAEPVPAQPLIAQAVTPQAPRRAAAATTPAVQPAEAAPAEQAEPALQAEMPEAESPAAPEEERTADEPFIQEDLPSFLNDYVASRKPVKMSVGAASGIVGGGTLLAAAAALLSSSGSGLEASPGQVVYVDPDSRHVGPLQDPQGLISSSEFLFPLKTGLSVRIPLADRLSVTTGLEYSLYACRVETLTRIEKMRCAHYLGIPVRLDWTLASNRWLDVYLGAGASVDYCVRATYGGRPIPKDRFAFSLLGAGGIQLNLTPRLGLYLEPELSWTAPSNCRVLNTFRTARPLTFSVATGLRYNFGK